jgi:hypothetical protein
VSLSELFTNNPAQKQLWEQKSHAHLCLIQNDFINRFWQVGRCLENHFEKCIQGSRLKPRQNIARRISRVHPFFRQQVLTLQVQKFVILRVTKAEKRSKARINKVFLGGAD